MTALYQAIHAALIELPKAEARCRRLLKRRDCRLVRQGSEYLAISRTTHSAEFGPANIDDIETWARDRS